MRLLYRADGGHPIGTGHLFRAARILTALARRAPLDAVLLAACDEGALSIARSAPARLRLLPRPSDRHAVKPLLEAEPVLDAIREHDPDVVVVDMLDTPAEAMAAIRATCRSLVTFDDRGPGRLYANLLINVLVAEPHADALSGSTRLLQGPAYAVLDPVFAGPLPSVSDRSFGPLEKVLVTMGGADTAGLTVKVARALQPMGELRRVEFCCGPAFPHTDALAAALEGAPWEYEVYVGLPHLLERYLSCDVAMVAGGLTMYETCATGTPAIAVCQPIDHQYELAEQLARAGCMLSVGYGADASEASLRHAVRELASDPARRRGMSEAGRALVDGRGTERAAAAIAESVRRA